MIQKDLLEVELILVQSVIDADSVASECSQLYTVR